LLRSSFLLFEAILAVVILSLLLSSIYGGFSSYVEHSSFSQISSIDSRLKNRDFRDFDISYFGVDEVRENRTLHLTLNSYKSDFKSYRFNSKDISFRYYE
jgi:Tfp pilus assembly protein PilE